ncbi:single-stranded DNA-binding protein, partial [Streptomyces diacarni]|uniref:single-stranded DNA-binding protein n=1 Tax=Streptomyces diacarni TaxID=2800381 RepID=UPI0033E09924
MAEIVATGNLGVDAELRTTPSGRSVLNFRIGDSKSKKNDQGGWDKVAENWFNVAIWGELAEFYAGKL